MQRTTTLKTITQSALLLTATLISGAAVAMQAVQPAGSEIEPAFQSNRIPMSCDPVPPVAGASVQFSVVVYTSEPDVVRRTMIFNQQLGHCYSDVDSARMGNDGKIQFYQFDDVRCKPDAQGPVAIAAQINYAEARNSAGKVVKAYPSATLSIKGTIYSCRANR